MLGQRAQPIKAESLSAEQFLKAVWPDKLLTHETVELRAIRRTDKKTRNHFVSTVEDFLTLARKYEGYEIYFGVATRFREGGKKQNCYRTRALWADFDDCKLDDLDFGVFQPNAMVASGGGVHAYWLLETPALLRDERWERIEAINRGLCKQFAGDIACADVSHVLRVPGFFNHKYDPNRLVEACLGGAKRYRLEDFETAGIVEIIARRSNQQITPGRVLPRLPQSLQAKLNSIDLDTHDGDKSRQDSAIITAMLGEDVSAEDCYATFAGSARGKDAQERKGNFHDYLTRTIRNAQQHMGSGEENMNISDAGKETAIKGRTVTVDFSPNSWEKDFKTKNQLSQGRPRFVVESLVPEKALTMISAPSFHGKSWLALSLGKAISTGRSVWGFRGPEFATPFHYHVPE